MTKKVTGKELQKLIEGVLSERFELPYDKDLTNFRKDTGLTKGDIGATSYNQLRKIDGKGGELSQIDLKIAKAFNKPEELINTIYNKTTSDDLKAKIADLGDDGYEFLKVIDSQNLNATDKSSTKVPEIKQNLESLLDHWKTKGEKKPLESYINLLLADPTPLNLTKAYESGPTQDLIATMKKHLQYDSVEKCEATFGSLVQATGTIKPGKIGTPFGDLPSAAGLATSAKSLGNLSSFQQGSLDASYVAMVEALSGANFVEKIQSLGKLAATISDKNKISGLNEEQTFEVAATIPLLTTLFNLSKTFDASAAGFEFEKFTAALVGGLQVGGANGATDVVAALKDGNVFRISTKLLASTELKQALGGSEGIDATLRKGPLYYLFGYKRGYLKGEDEEEVRSTAESSAYNQISFYCIKVEKLDDDNYVGRCLSEFGNFGFEEKLPVIEDIQVRQDEDGNQKTVTVKTLKAWNKEFANYPFARITALQNLDSNALALAEVVNTNVEQSANTLLKSIKAIFEKLENLKRNTQTYSAKKVTDPNKALDFVKQIGEDQRDLKKDYEDTFSAEEKVEFNVEFNKATPKRQVQTEQKITAKMLQKLIEEKFKK